MTTGVLLLNLGSPDGPDSTNVRRYLGEFLMDPYVIDIPWLARFLLVNGIILRTRPKKSAAAYQKVWTERGSPLLFHTIDLAAKVQDRLGAEFRVAPVMRYGRPSVADSLDAFRKDGIHSVIVLPLYPQFAEATSISSVKWVEKEAARIGFTGVFRNVGPFYDRESFLNAFAARVKESMRSFHPDHILFSFHGLPERHVKKVERVPGHCFGNLKCCDRITDANRDCYRAQCYFTARKIAEKVDLPQAQYEVSFQSRLGRTPWIRPYSDLVLQELGEKGRVRKLLVVSPSFVADCLETLEEIEIRSKADFVRAGGLELHLVPSLNSTDLWVESVREMILDHR